MGDKTAGERAGGGAEPPRGQDPAPGRPAAGRRLLPAQRAYGRYAPDRGGAAAYAARYVAAGRVVSGGAGGDGRPDGGEGAGRDGDAVCRTCYGSGLESYTDTGGDIKNRDCTSCAGTGFG